MKKLGVFLLVVLLSLMVVSVVSATERPPEPVCPKGEVEVTAATWVDAIPEECSCPEGYEQSRKYADKCVKGPIWDLEYVDKDCTPAVAGYWTGLECRPEIVGCGDEAALNYNPDADVFDEALCEYPERKVKICHHNEGKPYNEIEIAESALDAHLAHQWGGDIYPVPEGGCGQLNGCTDDSALNFNPKALYDDGSCEYPVPDPTVGFRTGCGDDCVPILGVNVDGNRGDHVVVTGQGREMTFGLGQGSERVRAGEYSWVLYKGEEAIKRGKVSVDPCDCPADPYVSFQQGCVDGVPVIGIDFVGEKGDTLSITGNGRDLSYTPGVYREQMRPFDSYTWAIFRGEGGMDKGTLLVDVCPVDPTPTKPPDDPPETGGGEAPIALVAALALVGGALLVLGVREAVSAKRT